MSIGELANLLLPQRFRAEAGRRGTRKVEGEMQTRAREIGAAEEAPVRTGGFRVPRLTGNCPTLTRLISRHSAIRHIRGFEGSSIPWIAIHTKKTSSLAHSYQG